MRFTFFALPSLRQVRLPISPFTHLLVFPSRHTVLFLSASNSLNSVFKITGSELFPVKCLCRKVFNTNIKTYIEIPTTIKK